MKNALQRSATLLVVGASLLTASLVNATPTALADPKKPTTAEAGNSFTVNAFHASNSSILRLFIQKNAPSTVWVELKNATGQLLFEAALGKRETGRAFAFDLSELPNGQYTVEVGNHDKKVVKAFNLQTP